MSSPIMLAVLWHDWHIRTTSRCSKQQQLLLPVWPGAHAGACNNGGALPYCAALCLCVQLQHTHAMLMLLGNINYLVQKMSSTVVSSLMTGVPIIADSQVLASYTFLKPEHVFLVGPQETEMDVMQRVRPGGVWGVLALALLQQQRSNSGSVQSCMPLSAASFMHTAWLGSSQQPACCGKCVGDESCTWSVACGCLACRAQVVRMSPAEVFNVRQRVLALQQVLNKRAFAVLQAFMPLVEDLPLAPAVE